MKWKNIGSGYESIIEKLQKAPPHEVLGVPINATLEEIKKAYRKKISISHPDRSSSFMKTTDEELSKLINSAYEKLTSAKR